ncbi:hypothetical protein IEQ34_008268 [Dendrobium chrysotoxum]|uniref:TFIIS N-terminal domain-containing protein n=1 Tax=Dendrobium chrysotoxum TaxID=161865 RepID=A0AAV7H5A1_DENCH|nr:hypothetical protein IEQ34_008268 [Dendrobium chrysotoxum]
MFAGSDRERVRKGHDDGARIDGPPIDALHAPALFDNATADVTRCRTCGPTTQKGLGLRMGYNSVLLSLQELYIGYSDYFELFRMKLEDFPILTEMKGGISSIAGVEELVSVMQKQKDCVSINVDIFKQWSTLLSIISSIDKKAYLDHFVRLDGLNYLHEWLMQAQKFTDCAVEEFVNSLLTTIERLPVNVEKFISCGIMITVEQLRGHKSITVKNKSQVLLDRWNNAVIGGTGFHGLGVGVEENFHPVHIADSNVIEKDLFSAQAIAKSLRKESSERAAEEVSVGTESHHSNLTRCSDSTHVENNTKFIKSNLALTASSSNSTCVDEVRDCNSSGSSLALDSCQEKFFTVSCLAVESDHERTYGFHTAFQWDDNMQDSASGDVQVGSHEIEKEKNKMKGYKCTSLQKGTFDLSSSSTLSTSMPLEEGLDHAPQNLVDREGELSGLKNVEYQEKGPQCRMSEFFKTSDETSRAGGSQEIAVDVNLKASLHAESPNPVDSHLLGSKLNRIVKKSVFGLEDEEMDALEVARQVAIDVELEVVGYKEHFSNSPDDFCGEAAGVQSPDLADVIQYKPGIDAGKFLPSEHSSKYVFSRKSDLQLSDGIIDDQMTHKQVSESPSMMPAAKEQDLNVENSQYRFDLNEDIYKGEIECSASPISTSTAKFSTPIVVFASKGVPRLPVLSIQFGAESGWRGYSATSAFQPIAPRKTPKIVKVPDLKQKLKILEIDLNVNETQNDGIVDTTLLRQIPVSSSHPPRESAVEVSSRNVEKLKLDLNRIGDEDEAVKFSLNYGLQLHDVDRLSTASSSRSKQHYTRNFNLNDNPTILVDGDASSFHGKTTSKHFPTRGSSKIDDDDSAIKTTGLRMPVDRKLCKGQAQQEPFLNNGIVDSIRPAKPMMHYPQISPAYGCNILQAGAAVPLPPTFLCKPGSVPYMVDSRGTALIPQVMELTGMSSIPAVNRQLPVVMDVPGAPMGLSGFFPTVTRLAPCETGRRNADANLNHLLIHNGKPEEKVRTFQLSSLGMVLKRKEPDSSLEGRYPLGFRQMPFWK